MMSAADKHMFFLFLFVCYCSNFQIKYYEVTIIVKKKVLLVLAATNMANVKNTKHEPDKVLMNKLFHRQFLLGTK